MNIEHYSGFQSTFRHRWFFGCSGPGCCNFVRVYNAGKPAYCCMGCQGRKKNEGKAKYRARKRREHGNAIA